MGATGDGVTVAAIGALGLLGATAITAFFAQRKQARTISDAIGTPNGAGNVVQMVERVIRNQGQIDQKIVDMHAQTDQKIADLHARTESGFVERTAKFEQALAPWQDRVVANEQVTAGLVVTVGELKENHGQIMDRLDSLVASSDRPGQVMDKLDELVEGQVAPKFAAMDEHLDAQDVAAAELDAAVQVVREQTAPEHGGH